MSNPGNPTGFWARRYLNFFYAQNNFARSVRMNAPIMCAFLKIYISNAEHKKIFSTSQRLYIKLLTYSFWEVNMVSVTNY